MYWLSSTSGGALCIILSNEGDTVYIDRYVSAIPSPMGAVFTYDWCIISHLPTRIRARLIAGLRPYKSPGIAKREKSISPLYPAGALVTNDTLKI